MARQTFLSKEFFVPASEERTKALLYNLPQFLDGIKFFRESKINGGLTFLYEQPTKEIQKIDVSTLPLNDEFTHITVHVSYTDGHSFHGDSAIKNVLRLFEQALLVTAAGKKFEQPVLKKKSVFHMLSAPLFGVLFLSFRKKFS